jgi:hypothetical protein
MHYQTVTPSPVAAPDHRREVVGPPEPLVRREHGLP